MHARSDAELANLRIGLSGASTGAAAALVAAAQLPQEIAAMVSRGGRPDLAGTALKDVRAATLLIVGGADYGVIEFNCDASDTLTCEKRLEIVPGATHRFEEPSALVILGETAHTAAMLTSLLIGATIFSNFIATTGAARSSAPSAPWMCRRPS